MKPIQVIFLLATILFLGARCGSVITKPDESGEVSKKFDDKMNASESWQNQMQSLEKSLVEIYPLVVDPIDFEAQKNEKKIIDSLKRLNTVSAKVNHSPMTAMNDPTLAFISFDFHEQVNNVDRAFSMGKKDYARFELLKLTQFCIECHTQSNKGPNFGYSQFAKKIEGLPAINQAEIYIATRRFDEALKSYMDFFNQTEISWDAQFKSEQAVHNALSILIRFKRDPEATRAFLEKIEKVKFVPLYLKAMVPVWKADIKKWSSEAKSMKPSISIVKMWIDRSNSRMFDYGRLGSEVWNQLSISYLHEFLENTRFKPYKADVLWLLGASYINGLNSYQSSLGEKYLEVCIRAFPNSFSAHRCYFKLEEYVYDTNSGSAGTFLSIEEDRRLKELKALSEPK
jgi:hypothetical protein